jgi:DNA methyltransferase 1-associated protein 1
MTSELKSMIGENYAEQPSIPTQNHQKELQRKTKDYIKRQTGLKRELIKLIGGVPSIVERSTHKVVKRSNWVWSKFSNPSRKDKLQLEHWQRKEDVGKEYDTSYNRSIEIVEFTKDEYDKLIKPNDRNWNYEQTMYLWDLIKQYQLKFVIIFDRFDEKTYGERTVESLKDRYYSVARTILEHRRLFDHPIIKSGYNYEQEIKRRTYLEKTMNKSFAELKEENYIMEMAENLNKKMEKNENFEKVLNQKLSELPPVNQNNLQQNAMSIDEGENSINNFSENKLLNNIENENKKIESFGESNNNGQTFEDFLKDNITRNDSFVYLRSQKLKHNLPVSEKIQERVDNYMKEFNIPEKLIPTAKVEMAYDNLRNNVILYTSLKKYLDKKQKEYDFLQKKYQEYQQKNLQLNPNQVSMGAHPQSNRNVPRSDKNIPQIRSGVGRPLPPPEHKEDVPIIIPNKNMQNINNISQVIKGNDLVAINNQIIQPNVDLKNNSINASNVNTNNEQQDSKQPGHKEKKKRMPGTPKARKRKNANDEDAPAEEEKEPKSNSKKKKKGTK